MLAETETTVKMMDIQYHTNGKKTKKSIGNFLFVQQICEYVLFCPLLLIKQSKVKQSSAIMSTQLTMGIFFILLNVYIVP